VQVLDPAHLNVFRSLPLGVKLLFVISTAMFPSLPAGRYEFAIGRYRVEARNLFWFLLSLALLPLTRRRFRLTPDGLDALTYFGCKRFVRWDDIASLDFSKLSGFVLKLVDGCRLYFRGARHGLASFSEEAAARLTADRMTARAKASICAYRARLF
jgi:hypothetical protein